MDLSKLNLPEEVRPVWVKGVPACPRDEATCPSFDGKRGRATGFRPSDICGRAVEAMAQAIPGFLPPECPECRNGDCGCPAPTRCDEHARAEPCSCECPEGA